MPTQTFTSLFSGESVTVSLTDRDPLAHPEETTGVQEKLEAMSRAASLDPLIREAQPKKYDGPSLPQGAQDLLDDLQFMIDDGLLRR
jgi:hypothetical protein